MKRYTALILTAVIMMTVTGCTAPWQKSDTKEQYDGYIYYLNSDHTDLTRAGFNFGNKTGQQLADEIAERIVVNSDNSDASPLPAGVVIEKAEVIDQQVHVHLNKFYEKASLKDDALCRCALVESFMQIPGVTGVKLYIGDEPMTDENGDPYDLLTYDNFMFSSSGIPGQSKNITLSLYFGAADGEYLSKESVPAAVESGQNTVRVIVDKLLDGPAYEGEQPVIPEDTIVLGVSVDGDTAYINLGSGFSENDGIISPKLAVYSIVNSVTENTDITQVQIQIEGSTPSSYGGEIDLRYPLKPSHSIVK